MSQFTVRDLSLPFELTNFNARVLIVDSGALKSNPLNDPAVRHNYILEPKKAVQDTPVWFHLSGYYSTGYQSFAARTLEQNVPQWIDEDTGARMMPPALHVFVDAMTYWGGSQFINSPGSGNYSDYILNELCPAIMGQFNVGKSWWLIGGSSGGYGALHLLTTEHSQFSGAIAIAPDSFFEASLLPEIYQTLPQLVNYRNLGEIRELISNGELQEKRHFFSMMNVIAMAHCYAPEGTISKTDVKLPVDFQTGKIREDIWQRWLEHDPLVFLPKRKEFLRGKKVFLDVGKYDEHNLQFGTRQIATMLDDLGIENKYTEFSGTHRGLGKRRRWLMQNYRSQWLR